MKTCLLILVLTVAAAITQAGPDETAITQTLRAAETAWNAGDIPGYMQAYWQSDQLRFASGGTVSYGWQPVLKRYLAHYPDRATMGHLTFSDLDIKLTGPDHAVVFGHWRLDRQDDAPSGLFTLIWQRFPAGWRIVHDHTSSAKP